MCKKQTWHVLSVKIDILKHKICIEYTLNVHYITITKKVGKDHIFFWTLNFINMA